MILIDDRLNPWLLEVNLGPSLNCDCSTDDVVKRPMMLNDLFEIIDSDVISQRRHHRRHQRNGQRRSTPATGKRHPAADDITNPDPCCSSVVYRGNDSVLSQDVEDVCHNDTCHCRQDVSSHGSAQQQHPHKTPSEDGTRSPLNPFFDRLTKTVFSSRKTMVHRNIFSTLTRRIIKTQNNSDE